MVPGPTREMFNESPPVSDDTGTLWDGWVRIGPKAYPSGTLTTAATDLIWLQTGGVAKLKEFKKSRGRELMAWGTPESALAAFNAAQSMVEAIGDGGRKSKAEQDALRKQQQYSAWFSRQCKSAPDEAWTRTESGWCMSDWVTDDVGSSWTDPNIMRRQSYWVNDDGHPSSAGHDDDTWVNGTAVIRGCWQSGWMEQSASSASAAVPDAAPPHADSWEHEEMPWQCASHASSSNCMEPSASSASAPVPSAGAPPAADSWGDPWKVVPIAAAPVPWTDPVKLSTAPWHGPPAFWKLTYVFDCLSFPAMPISQTKLLSTPDIRISGYPDIRM
jgi:hypothetical protein